MAVDLTIRVAGENGEGLLSVGVVASQAFTRMGLSVYTFNTPPSEIKGGASMVQTRVSDGPVFSQGGLVDLLMVWNQENYDLHVGSLRPGGLLLYDPGQCRTPDRTDVRACPVPLDEIIRNGIGNSRPKNVLAFAVLASILGVPRDFTEAYVRRKFRKRADILPLNLAAVEQGYAYGDQHVAGSGVRLPTLEAGSGRVLLTGNQAIALGMIAGGVQFFAGYPITPASDIMEFLSHHLSRFGGVVVQAEDEIASLAAVVGASFAGRKSATATSGPGLALMVEQLGLATMQELPVVVVDVQRGGPSTGLPTRPEQSDLDLAVYGRHGDAPRIVLAPSNVEECFTLSMRAVALAEKYQTPVILLSDQHLSHRSEAVPSPDPSCVPVVSRALADPGEGPFHRYALTDDGISPAAVPGTPGTLFVGTGLEHDEAAHINCAPRAHEVMMRKRQAKIDRAVSEAGLVERHGADPAEIGLICWGSTEGPAREAMALAEAKGMRVSLLTPKMLWPLPEDAIRAFVESAGRVAVVEANHSGQLANLIEGRLCRPVLRCNKWDGTLFTATDVLSFIEGVMADG